MPSAFPATVVEPFGGGGDAACVSVGPKHFPNFPLPGLYVLLGCGLAGCTGSPPQPAPQTVALPTAPVAVVANLPAGTWLCPALAADLPDEPVWRAAAVWWREALRQTVAFAVHEGAVASAGVVVRLAIAPGARTLVAFGELPQRGELALGGESFADGDLTAAIDRLAWTVRKALGEDAAPPVAVAACTSADARVVLGVDDGRALLRDGSVPAAIRALRTARQRDGASPLVLDALAAATLLVGDAEGAERICREALGYTARLSPTTQHRLARTMLMARASLKPDAASQRDRDLALLAATAARERPHDPEVRITTALAANFLGEFAAARPQLEALVRELPDQAILSYHLGWAQLATGDAAGAVASFAAAAVRLPPAWLALPRAMALFEAGHHTELDVLLADLLHEARGAPDQSHAVLRMQAAHAYLQGNGAAAAECILADCRTLLTDPLLLDQHAGEFAEAGAVLVRLGRAADLPPLLAAIQGQRSGSPIADVCAYLGGLCEIAKTGEPARTTVDRLAQNGENAWSALLSAYGHEVRGEVADQQADLARAAKLSDSPMTKALLANGLAAIGRTDEAEALRTALRRELATIHLRRRPQSPLLGPELAFAFVGR